MTFTGYLGGNVVDTRTVDVVGVRPTLYRFYWSGIDSVSFIGAHFQTVLDNITVNAPRPRPGAGELDHAHTGLDGPWRGVALT